MQLFLKHNHLKFFKVMRLTLIFIFIILIQVSATSYSQSINLDVSNMEIRQVIKSIEQQSDYRFFYTDGLNDLNRRVDLKLTDQRIDQVLLALLDDTQLGYQLVDNKLIMLAPKGVLQEIVITGTVTDTDGAPLPGVTIMIKGTQQGTTTGANGEYSLPVQNENTILVFSYIGFSTQEMPVGNRRTIHVMLNEDTRQLDEVVVVGYGTRVRGALTGSIAQADSKTFETRPVIRSADALQGAIPGMTIIRQNSRPGYDAIEIQIRGYSSINGNTPLILIDGIASDMHLINPGDIENVTVLKDAAASIYGARASDGVILITTKQGKAGKPKLTYSGSFGVKMPHFLKTMATTLHTAEMYNEAQKNIGLTPASEEVMNKIRQGSTEVGQMCWLEGVSDGPAHYGYHNWEDMIIGKGIQQNHHIAINGGSDNSTYLVSAAYNHDGGFFKFGDRSRSNRYNVSANNNFKNIFNRLNLDTRIQFDNRNMEEPSQTQEVLNWMYRCWRFVPMYTPGGNFYTWPGTLNVANFMTNGGTRYDRASRFTFNAKGDLKIVEGLKLVGQYGLTLNNSNRKTEWRTMNGYDWNDTIYRVDTPINSVDNNNSFNRFNSFTAYLEFNKTLAGKHNFNAMAGSSHEEFYTDYQNVTGRDLLSNDLFTLNLSNKTDIRYLTANGYENEWALTSFFGRVGYNYDMKYMIDFTLRADGSSKFAPSKRWSAVFPAIQAAWNLGNEKFISSLNIFDNLKIRLSWGKSGNQNLSSFGNYDYIPLISLNNNTYPFGAPVGVMAAGATSAFASESRTWETVTTSNVGLDFSLLRSRLSGSIDVYLKKNSDMLVRQDLPAVLGGTAPTQNIGELETKGFDLSLGWKDRIGDFTYGITAMLWDSQNKLVKLKGNDSYAEGRVTTREGYPLYSYFGYKSDGIIKTQAQLDEYKKLGGIVPARIGIGDMMYRDLDGDGQITAFGADGKSGDMTYLGNFLPRYTYSSRIDLSYKNIDFNVFLQGVGKRFVVRSSEWRAPFWSYWFQPLEYHYEKTWTPERPNAEIPRIIQGGRGWDDVRNWNYRTSDAPHRFTNVAYLRVKMVSLAYRLPQSFCNTMKVQSVRLYASGQDLLTFCKGTWGNTFDPEEGWQYTDEQTYPFYKSVTFGIDVKF